MDHRGNRAALAQNLSPEQPLEFQALPEHLDLITARTEFYEKPAALPTVESSNIKMDLHRRDFSINTLALRLDEPYFGKLYDFWGGYTDLQNGVIRVLHALSFVDDATRILRALRFASRFEFRIEPRTLSLMQASLAMLNEVSGSRLRHEIDLILLEPKAVDIFVAMVRANVMQAIHPKLPWCMGIKIRMGYLNTPAAITEWETESNESQLNLRQVYGYCYWLEKLPEHDWSSSQRACACQPNWCRIFTRRGSSVPFCRSLANKNPARLPLRWRRWSLWSSQRFTSPPQTQLCASHCAPTCCAIGTSAQRLMGMTCVRWAYHPRQITGASCNPCAKLGWTAR